MCMCVLIYWNDCTCIYLQVMVTSQDPSGWWQGYVHASEERYVAWFPCTYITWLSESRAAMYTPDRGLMSGSMDSAESVIDSTQTTPRLPAMLAPTATASASQLTRVTPARTMLPPLPASGPRKALPVLKFHPLGGTVSAQVFVSCCMMFYRQSFVLPLISVSIRNIPVHHVHSWY